MYTCHVYQLIVINNNKTYSEGSHGTEIQQTSREETRKYLDIQRYAER